MARRLTNEDYTGKPDDLIRGPIFTPVQISEHEWDKIKELFRQVNYRSIVIPSDSGIDFEIVYLERVSIGQDSLMEMGLEEQ